MDWAALLAKLPPSAYRRFRDAFDRVAGAVLLLIASPLIFAIAMAVLLVGGAVSALAFFPREGAAGAAAAAAIGTGGQLGAGGQAGQDRRSEVERFMATAPRVPLVIPPEGAKVLIVKFNDFQCPPCAQSYLSYKPILAKYEAQTPGAVKVVLKDYPLNPGCNANVGMVHPAACEAAVAVRLAAEHNRAEAMAEWCYTHQPSMTSASVRQAAHDIGGVNDFDARFASTLELVKGDTGLGKQLGVKSTPTFFIDGVRIEGAWQPQFFDQAIAYELARAAANQPSGPR